MSSASRRRRRSAPAMSWPIAPSPRRRRRRCATGVATSSPATARSSWRKPRITAPAASRKAPSATRSPRAGIRSPTRACRRRAAPGWRSCRRRSRYAGGLTFRVIHGGVGVINRFVFASQRDVLAEVADVKPRFYFLALTFFCGTGGSSEPKPKPENREDSGMEVAHARNSSRRRAPLFRRAQGWRDGSRARSSCGNIPMTTPCRSNAHCSFRECGRSCCRGRAPSLPAD